MMSALQRSIVLRALLRCRFPMLAVAAVAVALIERRATGPSSDGGYFASAGRDLLSTHGLHVYASSGLQAGPLQLALFGVLSHLTSWLHLPFDSTYAVISTLASTAVIVGGVRLLRRRVGLAESPAAELVIGVLAIAWLVATEAYTSGHPAELIVPALWIAAAALAYEGKAGWAGTLVGVGAGFETWALLGLPVLLLAADWRRRLLGLGMAVVTAVLLYVPFLLAGPFRMGDLQWGIARHSLIHAIDPTLANFPWSARLAQAVIVVALGTVAWAGIRRDAEPIVAVWLLPAVLAVAKATTEAAGYDWYWLPAQLILLAGCGCVGGLSRQVLGIAVVAEAVVVIGPLQRWQFGVAALVALLLAAWSVTGVAAGRPAWTLRSIA
jgi:hypothetical protein